MPYIGTSPSNGVRRVHTYTATASQTTFTGASSEGVTLSYADTNYIDVFQNGVLLGSADYTSTSGTSVVLAQGASADDLIVIVVYDVFSVADTVSKTNGGSFDSAVTMSNNLTVSGAFTSQGIDDNADATAITIDSSENVGIGRVPDTDQYADLTVLALGNGSTIYASKTGSPYLDVIDNAFLNSAGNFEYQTSNASSRMEFGSGNITFHNAPSGTAGNTATFTEIMRITSGNNFLVNTTTTTINSSNFGTLIGGTGSDIGSIYTAKNVNGGDIVVQIYGNAGKAFIYGDGDMANDNGTFGSFSDQTLKENIVDAQSQWADIKALQIRNYNLISNPDLTQIGVVAQELEASGMSGLVAEKDYDGEGNVKKTVKLSVLHMKAVKALQEAMIRIEALETANTALEARITALENAE